MSTIVKKIVPWLLAVLLLAFALRNVSFDAIRDQFAQANYVFIGLVLLVTGVSVVLRGKRWQQPLFALGYRPTVFRTTVAIQAGTIAGLIVFGTGELTRCGTLQRTDGIPLAQGIGSVLGERVLDLLMLIPLFLLAILLELNRMTSLLSGFTVAEPSLLLRWLLILGLIGAALGLIAFRWALKHPAVRRHRLFTTGRAIVQGLWKGFGAIRNLPNPALFIGLTLLSQFIACLSTYLMLLSLDTTHSLPPTAALTIVAITGVGGLLVPTQGGIGTFHFLVSQILVLYGFTIAQGAVVATFIHAVGFGITLLVSSLSFIAVPMLLANKKTMANESVSL